MRNRDCYPVRLTTLKGGPPEWGYKALRLAEAAEYGHLVPAACVIPSGAFHRAMERAGAAGTVRDLLRELRFRRTHGVHLTRELQEVLRGVNTSFAAGLARDALELIGEPESVSVRSSSCLEDRVDFTAAGMYASVLRVSGCDAVARAIMTVWLSAFTESAVARAHAAGLEPVPPAVIVQVMVEPDWSGVAFSHHPSTGEPTPFVEAVRGTCEHALSGRAPVEIAHDGVMAPPHPVLDQAARAATLIAAQFGWPVDVEWAVQDELSYILQVRPAVQRRSTETGQPTRVLNPCSVEASRLAVECGGVVARFILGKKAEVRTAAHQLNLECIAAVVLDAAPGSLTPVLVDQLPLRSRETTVDCGELRGVVIPRDRLYSYLTGLAVPHRRLRAVIRDNFMTSGPAVISTPLATGAVLAEWCEEGLLAATRGLAATIPHVIGAKSLPADGLHGLDREAWNLIFAGTVGLARSVGAQAIEWYAGGGRPILSDATVTGTGARELEVLGRVISAGHCAGRIVIATELAALTELSKTELVSVNEVLPEGREHAAVVRLRGRLTGLRPAIVVATLPFSALSLVMEQAAGFIFAGGGMLSHLAITLREAGKPAVFVPNATEILSDGEWVVLPDIAFERGRL